MYKSSRNRLIAFGLTLVVALAATPAATEEDDPVLLYYWRKAREAASRYDPDTIGLSYRFTARSYRYAVVGDGRVSRTDSVIQHYFVSDGALDSVNTVVGEADRFGNLEFGCPPVFESDYHLNLFPNDTGGARLAIGLMSDSTLKTQPDGLAVIDRQQYFLHSLYMYYPAKEGYRRFTRSFRFVLADDYLFPDSVWEVATKLGVFFSESYRLETGITDIRVWRTGRQPEPPAAEPE